MHNQTNSILRCLSISVRAVLVLMLILPAFLPMNGAQAGRLPVSSSLEAAVPIGSTPPQAKYHSPVMSDIQAAPLLEENFNYGSTSGNLTAVTSNWTAHSSAGGTPVGYINTSLEMSTYSLSGIGGSATFAAGTNFEDVNRLLPSEQTTGTLYYSALVNISQASTAGDYFMHFKNSSTGYYGRLFAKDNGSGNLLFGIAAGSTGTIYGVTTFTYGTTYLVVVKYNMGSGASDLFVLDTCASIEPAPLASSSIAYTSTSVTAIAIRQGSNVVVGGIDGIRVATSWADTVICTEPPPPTLTIGKTAPASVDTNETYTYTLSVDNALGETASQVVITDSLPISLTVGDISDEGVLLPTNVVSWTVPTLADGDSVNLTVAVTAPATDTIVVNDNYGVWASNWLTFTLGAPITTTVVTPEVVTPIGTARAAGDGWSGTVQGNVTVVPGKIATNSFAIQDATGGLYVYPGSLTAMDLGALVKVQGVVDNYNGLLELSPVTKVEVMGTGTPPDPVITDTGVVSDTQGLLIQIQGIVTSITGTGTQNRTIRINDGSGEVIVYIYTSKTLIDSTGIAPGVEMRVIGLSYNYNHVPQVIPRYQSDLYIFPPEVTETYPLDGATNVSLYRPLEATFNHAMNAATIATSSFTLTESAGPVSGAVSYDAGTKTATFDPVSILSENTLYTATLTTGIKDIYNIALTSEYSWTFTSGLVDLVAPAIAGREPAPDAVGVPLNSSVVVTFTEDLNPSTVNQSAFLLEGPYGAVPYTLTYNPSSFVVTLNPDLNLLPTTSYTVTVLGTVEDWAGHALGADSTWTFDTMVEPEMNVFFGDLHNHTSISDGSGTPAQALAAGKAAGFDFMAISDHSYSINDTEWADTLAAVNAATTSSFLALRGFEYTQGAEGHINVYNTVRHAVRTDTTSTCTFCDYTPNLEAGTTVDGFYEWAASTGLIGLDSAGTVMQFNHPGWINFNDWTYHPEVSSIAKLEEVGNGNGASYDFSEDQFIRSLDYGWKVGATNNADTHTASWGVNTDHRTGVVMTELTKDSLLEALQARRTFATEDKNFSLLMKANGAWMGSEIANTGSVLFDISGSDPDGELAALVQIITDQGKVAMEFEPNTASFNLTPELDITTGVHYFYVKVTQADGDLIVSSPVWTMGLEDIAITDLVIQPTIPSIYSPSLLTVRVTNRNSSARSISVTLDVDGAPVGSPVVLSVPGNGDAFANFSWQPAVPGDVTVTAQITGAPVGDNPDDNASALHLIVTEEQVPLILIDAGHGNLNAVGNEMQMFFNDLSAHQYNVLKNLDELTAADLNPVVVKLLLITAPATDYTNAELTAISDYVKAGGSLWLCGMSDYSTGALVANRVNAILAAIETGNGTPINMRLNDDEILDGNDNNGYPWGVTWGSFPMTMTTGIGINVEATASWSVASLVGHETNQPLTSSTPNVQIVVQGDLDIGYTGSYNDPNHTSNTDADSGGDAYIYNPGWVYPAYPDTVPAGAIPVPMGAVTDLPGAAGRILLYGDSNDAFTTYAYTAGDGKQNELFNLEAVLWLLGEPLQKSTIAEARAQSQPNQPNNLDKLVWIEGEITAAYGEFFNVLYIQDETGGITVHAPAGDINSTQFTRGTKVRVVGTVGIYNGDTEIEFFEAEMVQVIEPGTGEPLPMPMSTHEASLEENQGWLAVITGTVTAKLGNDTIIVNDNSGPVRVFLDGYNGDFDDIQVRNLVQVTGLISEDGDGSRIRVRNHGMHPEYADDVIKPIIHAYFPMVNKH